MTFRRNYQEELDTVSTTLCRVLILCQNMYQPYKSKVTEHVFFFIYIMKEYKTTREVPATGNDPFMGVT